MPCGDNKKPIPQWKGLQNELPSIEQVKQWFTFGVPNIGFITGAGSGNVEVIDLDCKYDLAGTLDKDFFTMLKARIPDTFKKLVIEKTLNEGYHIFYRCSEIACNSELAKRPANEQEKQNREKTKVLIETRGQGGFIVTTPSPGYELTQGTFDKIPTITKQERAVIFDLAREFDQRSVAKAKTKSCLPQKNPKNELEWKGKNPWDDYNERHDHTDVLKQLEKHGYTNVGYQNDSNVKATKVLRPGDTTADHSGYIYHDTGGKDVFQFNGV